MSNTVTILTAQEIEAKTRHLWERDEEEIKKYWRENYLKRNRLTTKQVHENFVKRYRISQRKLISEEIMKGNE